LALLRRQNAVGFICVAPLFLLSCVSPKEISEPATVSFSTIATGLPSVHSVTIVEPNTYAVSHVTAEGKSVISKIKKGVQEVVLTSLDAARGISYDERRAQLHVADGKALKIFKWKKPTLEPTVVLIPTDHYIGDVAFSTIRGLTYATDPEGRTIWEIEPKKKTVRAIVTAENFDALKVGFPSRLLPSNDGRRLYITTTNSAAGNTGGAAIVVAELKQGGVRVIQSFSGLTCLDGLGLFRDHFIVSDCKSGAIRSVLIKNGDLKEFPVPPDLSTTPVSLTIDNNDAVLAVQPNDGSPGSLLRFVLKIKA